MKTKFTKYIFYTILGILIMIIVVKIGNPIRISNSEAYEIAKKAVIANNEVKKEIGIFKEFGKFPSGSISIENGVYYAQLEMKVIGSKNEVQVVVFMRKSYEKWIVNDLFIYE